MQFITQKCTTTFSDWCTLWNLPGCIINISHLPHKTLVVSYWAVQLKNKFVFVSIVHVVNEYFSVILSNLYDYHVIIVWNGENTPLVKKRNLKTFRKHRINKVKPHRMNVCNYPICKMFTFFSILAKL